MYNETKKSNFRKLIAKLIELIYSIIKDKNIAYKYLKENLENENFQKISKAAIKK